ncbi:MAG: mandelate racemase/muconate lactonizing [Beijerinckiaceae bacterium]|nr:MAG: mandelate racemase/muconate lactonizing [Beijerinckiaceae bacterium]
MRHLETAVERWPIAGSFTISRGSRTEAVVVVATITDGGVSGAGECVPYARYGESIESVVAQIESVAPAIRIGASRVELLALLPPGAARNAVDCALWDLEAKKTGKSLAELAGMAQPKPMITAYTLSLGTPESMREAAEKAAHRPLLKVKLGGEGDPARIAAVRAGAPNSRIIVDANEGWRAETLAANLAACEAAGVELIEQPMPAGVDAALHGISTGIAICADESIHDAASLAHLPAWYTAVNIKLDKTGGLTDALALLAAARARGLKIMVGCMLGTSLAMTPAVLLAEGAEFVDLDGPLLLAKDREGGLTYDGSILHPPA